MCRLAAVKEAVFFLSVDVWCFTRRTVTFLFVCAVLFLNSRVCLEVVAIYIVPQHPL